MTSTTARHPLSVALLLALLLAVIPAGSYAGIRMDGTEFQGASQRPSLDGATITRGSATAIPATRIVYTFGQAVLAKGEITNSIDGQAVKIGLGYDFNAQNTTIWGCTCQNQGNLAGGDIPDAMDINAMINTLFFNGSNPQDPLCPVARVDMNCDGYPTAADLTLLINQTFYNGAAPCQPCAED